MSDSDIAGSGDRSEPDEASADVLAGTRSPYGDRCAAWMIGCDDGGEGSSGSDRCGSRCVLALVLLAATMHSCQESLADERGAALLDQATSLVARGLLYGHVVY